MKRKKIIILGIIVTVLGFLIYRSPDNEYRLQEDTTEAIEIGRTFAFGLFTNTHIPIIRSTSIEPARSKLKDYDFTQAQSLSSIIEHGKSQGWLFSLFSVEPEEMKLVALERSHSFIVMTFAYMAFRERKIVEIPGKGKILFAIAARYYEPMEDKAFFEYTNKLMRKIANLPILRYFSGYAKAKGSWVVIDYKYTYNRNDYYNWILSEGGNYTAIEFQRVQKEWEEWRKRPAKEFVKSINRAVDRNLNLSYDWANLTMELQIKNIQEMNKQYKKGLEIK